MTQPDSEDCRNIALPEEKWNEFLEILDAPAQPNEQLRNLLNSTSSVTLTEKGTMDFLSDLENPPKPTEALMEGMKDYWLHQSQPLSEADTEIVLSLMDSPPNPSPKLVEAAKSFQRGWAQERSGETFPAEDSLS